MDPSEAKLPGRLYVCSDVINEDRLPCADFGGAHGLTVNKGVGLAGPNRAGIDALPFGETLVEVISRFEIRNVDGVGVREENQAIAFGEFLEETQRVDWLGIESKIPCRGELLEAERHAQVLTQMEMPIVRGNAAFLPIRPARIFLDGGPQLFGSEGEALSEAELRPAKINAHQNAANIEDDRTDSGRTHALAVSRGGM